MYAVKEIFRTLQGEGGQMGRVAVFCRFTGCNLWSGREKDRATAVCKFCDTDFVGNRMGYSEAEHLAEAIERCWGQEQYGRFVVLTGGEPLLQVDDDLIFALSSRGFAIALETNGTLRAPMAHIDWICVSPKTRDIEQKAGDELKFVFPQVDLRPEMFEHLAFGRFSLSPMAGEVLKENTAAAIAYCLAHPKWRLTQQSHKLWGIP